MRPFCPNWEVAEVRIRYTLTNRQLVADTVCMPPLLVASLTLLSSDLEGATSRLTVGGWARRRAAAVPGHPQESFPGVWRHQTGTEGGSHVVAFTSATQALIVSPAGQQTLTASNWSNFRPLRMRHPPKRGRTAGVQVGLAEA